MQCRTITSEEIDELAKLPPLDVLRGQVLGAVTSPISTIVGLFTAPLRDLHGLIQARIDQLGGDTETEPEADVPKAEASSDPQLADPAEAESAETKEEE